MSSPNGLPRSGDGEDELQTSYSDAFARPKLLLRCALRADARVLACNHPAIVRPMGSSGGVHSRRAARLIITSLALFGRTSNTAHTHDPAGLARLMEIAAGFALEPDGERGAFSTEAVSVEDDHVVEGLISACSRWRPRHRERSRSRSCRPGDGLPCLPSDLGCRRASFGEQRLASTCAGYVHEICDGHPELLCQSEECLQRRVLSTAFDLLIVAQRHALYLLLRQAGKPTSPLHVDADSGAESREVHERDARKTSYCKPGYYKHYQLMRAKRRTMASTRKDEPLLPTEAVRAMYRRGLDLAPGASVALTVLASDGSELIITVRNASDGLVEASCRDPRACDELRMLVGFRVAGAAVTPALRRTFGTAAPKIVLAGAGLRSRSPA